MCAHFKGRARVKFVLMKSKDSSASIGELADPGLAPFFCIRNERAKPLTPVICGARATLLKVDLTCTIR